MFIGDLNFGTRRKIPIENLHVTSKRHYLRTCRALQRANAGQEVAWESVGGASTCMAEVYDPSHISDIKWGPGLESDRLFQIQGSHLPGNFDLHLTWSCGAYFPFSKIWVIMVTFLELLWGVRVNIYLKCLLPVRVSVHWMLVSLKELNRNWINIFSSGDVPGVVEV